MSNQKSIGREEESDVSTNSDADLLEVVADRLNFHRAEMSSEHEELYVQKKTIHQGSTAPDCKQKRLSISKISPSHSEKNSQLLLDVELGAGKSVLGNEEGKGCRGSVPKMKLVRETVRPGAYSERPGETHVLRPCNFTTLEYSYSVRLAREQSTTSLDAENQDAVAIITDDEGGCLNASVNGKKDNERKKGGVEGVVEALPVNNSDIEQNIRQEIINQAVEPDLIYEVYERGGQDKFANKDDEPNAIRRRKCLIVLLAIILVIAGICGVVVFAISSGQTGNSKSNFDDTNSETVISTVSSTEKWGSRLEQVRERGFLRCGVFVLEENIDFWHCKAVAAAILGEPKFEYVRGTGESHIQRLRNHTIDLVTSIGMSWSSPALQDIAFASPTIFDGIGFSGLPKYVKCAEERDRNLLECSEMRICVIKGSPAALLLQVSLPESQLLAADDFVAAARSFIDGECNVISTNSFARSEYMIKHKFGYEGGFYSGRRLTAKTPYAAATLADDHEFADFVNAVLQSLIVAEKLNITKENVSTILSKTELFGEEYQNMFIDAITAVGNYGEAYEDAFPVGFPRGAAEEWNNGRSGLLYAYDLGDAGMIGPGPVPGGTIDRILKRGTIRCAIHLNRPGFSQQLNGTYKGMDIEYCRALAASLFQGRTDAVEFVELFRETDGFIKIANGDVDVVAGSIWNVQNDFREPITGRGYKFSSPYFFGFNTSADGVDRLEKTQGGDLCLLTSHADFQWSSFVECVLISLVHAEENGIEQRTFNDMPKVGWFGPSYERILRDAIFAVGNYGEVYEREVSEYIRREGRNMLNDFANPQFYYPDGLLQLK